MSFLKPTAASKSRERAVREDRTGAGATSASPSSTVPNFAQPLAQQLFRDPGSNSSSQNTAAAPALPDYSHVRSRVDSGLHEPRTQQAWNVTSRKRSRSPATDLAQYTTRCNDVVQRAQQLLERTRRQEELVAQALQQRLSQSPARRAPSWSSATSPHAPPAPNVTPVGGPQDGTLSDDVTPSRRTHSAAPLACPPPTPATGLQSPAPTRPPLPASAALAASPEKPSLFQRLRHSLQRLSGQMPPDASPVPAAPAAPAAGSPSGRHAGGRSASHARKSVHFVSPDKLEHVTPTKVQPHSEDDEDDEEDEDEEEETVRTEARSVSAAPLPAPPPSAVKPAKSRSRSRSSPSKAASRTTASPSPVPTARARERTASPPQTRGQASTPRRSDAVARVTVSSPRATAGTAASSSSHTTSPSPAASRSPSPAKKSNKRTDKKKAKAAKKAASKPAKSPKASTKPKAAAAKVSFDLPEEADAQPAKRGSSSRSSSVASTPEQAAKLTKVNREHHEEMLEFILNNSVKRCVSNFTKEQLVVFLHGEGVPAVNELDMTKKQLLDEIRALLGRKN